MYNCSYFSRKVWNTYLPRWVLFRSFDLPQRYKKSLPNNKVWTGQTTRETWHMTMLIFLSKCLETNGWIKSEVDVHQSWMYVQCYCAESVHTSKRSLKTGLYMLQPSLSLAPNKLMTPTVKRIDYHAENNNNKLTCIAWDPRSINAEPMTNPSLRVHCLITRHFKITPLWKFLDSKNPMSHTKKI